MRHPRPTPFEPFQFLLAKWVDSFARPALDLASLTALSSTLRVSIASLVIRDLSWSSHASPRPWWRDDTASTHCDSFSLLGFKSRISQKQSLNAPLPLQKLILNHKLNYHVKCSLALEVQSVDIGIVLQDDFSALYWTVLSRPEKFYTNYRLTYVKLCLHLMCFDWILASHGRVITSVSQAFCLSLLDARLYLPYSLTIPL